MNFKAGEECQAGTQKPSASRNLVRLRPGSQGAGVWFDLTKDGLPQIEPFGQSGGHPVRSRHFFSSSGPNWLLGFDSNCCFCLSHMDFGFDERINRHLCALHLERDGEAISSRGRSIQMIPPNMGANRDGEFSR